MSAESIPALPVSSEAALAAARTHRGSTVAELSARSPVLLVFLRHAGCTFCREALADLSLQRPALERAGTQLVLVHLGDDGEFAALAAHYDLEDVPRVVDPERELYRALGLRRASLATFLNPRLWWRGFKAAILANHGFGGIRGDAAQMPGVFLIRDGRFAAGFMHRSPADRPNYLEICERPQRAA